MSRKACHKEKPAKSALPGGPSKFPGKLATKRTLPRACETRCLEDLQNIPERLPQREGFLGFHFPTFWPFGLLFSCHFSLLDIHVLSFWLFGPSFS